MILFALFVSPLLHNSLENSFQTRRMWSWCLLISLAIIVFFATYPFRVQKIFLRLLVPISLILFSSFFLAIYPVNSLALYFLALILFLSLAYTIVTTNNSKNSLIFSVMLVGFCAIYAQWGIAQFVIQHDLGMSKLGESVLNQNTAGVASFYVNSEKIIRAYGPFAHANSFAGVLLVGMLVLYKRFNELKNRLFTQSILFLLSLGIITSFSRTALFGLVAISIFYMFKKKQTLLIPIVITAIIFASLVFQRSVDTHGVAVYDRLQGFSWYTNVVDAKVLLRGTGVGNYTNALKQYVDASHITYNPWDIAPVHCVPLLLLSELGIIVCTIVIFFLAKYMYTHKLWMYLVLLPTLAFDHYFVTQLAPVLFLIISTRLVV